MFIFYSWPDLFPKIAYLLNLIMINDFQTWWDGLTTLSRVYWVVAIPFSFIFIIQLVLTFIGGDIHPDIADGHADVSVTDDSGIHFQFISIKNITGFFTIFGWTGLGCIASGMTVGMVLLISTIAGLMMMLIMASLFFFIARLAESGNMNIASASGKKGTVYLRIPAKRASAGKIQIKISGFQTLDALTDEPEDIPTGAIVEVIKPLGDDLLLVKRI